MRFGELKKRRLEAGRRSRHVEVGQTAGYEESVGVSHNSLLDGES